MSPAPAIRHRCAWCGRTSIERYLRPTPLGVFDWAAEYEQRHGVEVLHRDDDGKVAQWWCRSSAACNRRRDGVAHLKRS